MPSSEGQRCHSGTALKGSATQGHKVLNTTMGAVDLVLLTLSQNVSFIGTSSFSDEPKVSVWER